MKALLLYSNAITYFECRARNRAECFFHHCLCLCFNLLSVAFRDLKKKEKSQPTDKSFQMLFPLGGKSPVRGGLRRHRANNHNQLETTWKSSISSEACVKSSGQQHRAGLGFADLAFGSVLSGGPVRVPTCACVPALRGKGTRCNGEETFQWKLYMCLWTSCPSDRQRAALCAALFGGLSFDALITSSLVCARSRQTHISGFPTQRVSPRATWTWLRYHRAVQQARSAD